MDLSKLLDLDQRLTLAVNGSDSIFWDNLMYVVTNTLSWSLLMLVLIMVVFKSTYPDTSAVGNFSYMVIFIIKPFGDCPFCLPTIIGVSFGIGFLTLYKI